jgi:hypothetical protein
MFKEELIWPMETNMLKENLMNRDEREIKQKKISSRSSKIEEFKQKISDDLYLDHAIKKIATDLSRYLTK